MQTSHSQPPHVERRKASQSFGCPVLASGFDGINKSVTQKSEGRNSNRFVMPGERNDPGGRRKGSRGYEDETSEFGTYGVLYFL